MRPGQLSRRDLLQGATGAGLSVAGLLLGGCSRLTFPAQSRVRRIGLITFALSSPPGTPTVSFSTPRVLAEELETFGRVEGRDFVIEVRFAENQADRLPVIAKELVDLRVDVIVVDFANSLTVARACRAATSTIPLVSVSIDLATWQAAGLFESVARPGGNLTGISIPGPEIRGRQLELLKQAVPGAARVAVLWVAEPAYVPGFEVARSVAPTLGVQIIDAGVRSLDEVDAAIARAAEAGAQAVMVIAGSFLLGATGNNRVIEAVARHRLPTLFGGGREHADRGGLMSYQGDVIYTVRRAASYAHRILDGARPADLPIEATSRFAFVINLKTAQSLGLTFPPDLLAQATDLIQ